MLNRYDSLFTFIVGSSTCISPWPSDLSSGVVVLFLSGNAVRTWSRRGWFPFQMDADAEHDRALQESTNVPDHSSLRLHAFMFLQ